MARQPRRDAKLKRLPREAQEEIHEWFHPLPAPEGEPAAQPMAIEAAQAEIALRHGFTVSRSSLYSFLDWFSTKLDGERMVERAEQAKLFFLKEYPEATPDDLERWAQLKFYADQLGEQRNGKLFAQMFKARTDREKLHAATRTKVQAGLDELRKEIGASPKAIEIFNKLQEVLGHA